MSKSLVIAGKDQCSGFPKVRLIHWGWWKGLLTLPITDWIAPGYRTWREECACWTWENKNKTLIWEETRSRILCWFCSWKWFPSVLLLTTLALEDHVTLSGWFWKTPVVQFFRLQHELHGVLKPCTVTPSEGSKLCGTSAPVVIEGALDTKFKQVMYVISKYYLCYLLLFCEAFFAIAIHLQLLYSFYRPLL